MNCQNYEPGSDTGMNCKNCGLPKSMHDIQITHTHIFDASSGKCICGMPIWDMPVTQVNIVTTGGDLPEKTIPASKIEELFSTNQPYDILTVLQKMELATEKLLHHYNYDGMYHEEFLECMKRSAEIRESIVNFKRELIK